MLYQYQNIIWSLILFALGASLASFYMAQIYRIEAGLKYPDIVVKDSFCEGCKQKLRWFELIPVFSYIFQKGACSRCGFRVNPTYPIFEAVFGISFVILFSYNATWEYYLLLNLLFFLALYDYYFKGFPQLITHIFLLITGVVFLYKFFLDFNRDLWTLVIAFSIMIAVLILNHFKKSFGVGDLFVVLMISFIVTLSQFVGVIFLSIILAGIYGALLIIFGKAKRQDTIPFVPFLFLGYILMFPLEPLLQRYFAYLVYLW